MALKEDLDLTKLPKHIAIIMDGNGRWAQKEGANRIFGHQNGVTSVREITEAAAELGISYLTLYAFSTENWNRPSDEINALMQLLVETIHKETPTLNKNNIRLLVIGDILKMPQQCQDQLQQTIKETAKNTGLSLVLALSYSSYWEITEAVKCLAEDVKKGELLVKEITKEKISSYLNTKDIPDPELLIRTSGEYRISNFLLWQIAYAELYFTPVLWPDFQKAEFYDALVDYQGRERRFGLTSEQIKKSN